MPSLESYTVVLRPDDNGTFVAYVPAIAGCHAWGQTQEDARTELASVFDMICEEYIEEGKSLPEDVDLAVAHAS
ncbi:MAG: type II toxin-antitoxin system HicB family antitoxin [Cyanobacteria bacterium J06626_6]